jgi:phospholipase/carboxylesterase
MRRARPSPRKRIRNRCFLAQGDADPVIPCRRDTPPRTTLRTLRLRRDWRTYAMPHAVCPEEIRDLGDWFDHRFAG